VIIILFVFFSINYLFLLGWTSS